MSVLVETRARGAAADKRAEKSPTLPAHAPQGTPWYHRTMPAALDFSSPEVQADLAYIDPADQAEFDALMAWEPSPHQEELMRCAKDPAHFFDTYLRSYDPREAATGNAYSPFVLFPRQREFIAWLQQRIDAREGGIVEKSRGVGASYLCVGFALHHWLFQPGFAAGFGSRKGEYVDKLGDPKSLFEKLRMLYRGLPDWMQPKGFIWSKHGGECRMVNPDNGATITGESGDGIGRGGRTSVYFVDEAAYLEHPKLADASLAENTNVRIDVSTPNGMDEFYQKTRSGRVKVFRLHWIDDPRRNSWQLQAAGGRVIETGSGKHPVAPYPTAFSDPAVDSVGETVIYPWYEAQRVKADYSDPSIMAQELDCDYLGSGRPRFNRAWLMSERERIYPNNQYAVQPLRIELSHRTAWAGDLTTFRDLEQGHSYAILADTARGLTLSGTADYSVAHVFDLETAEQVAHYRGQMSEIEFKTDLAALGWTYCDSRGTPALMVVEIPGPGEAVCSMLADTSEGRKAYPNIYSYWDDDARPNASGMRGDMRRLGLPMTETSKPEGDGKLASMLEDAERGYPGHIILNHPNTLEECIHYVRLRGQTCGAEAGAHDDEAAVLRLFAMIWPQYMTRGRKALSQLRPAPSTACNGSGVRIPR